MCWTCIHFCCPATNESHMPVMNFPDMFPALSSFWFWRGNTGPCSSFSAPSDPFQKNFLHIHRVIVIVDLVTKICCRMYKTMCTYCELPPSFPTLPVKQTHEVIVAEKNSWVCCTGRVGKREGAHSIVLYIWQDVFQPPVGPENTQIWLSKWRCARKSFAMQITRTDT